MPRHPQLLAKPFYFETSAVNFLCDRLTVADAVATKRLQNLKSRRWIISPVVIAEILMTANAERRDRLIELSQNLFDSELLPSPEEMLFEYIAQRFPVNETPRPLFSRMDIAEAWRDICLFPNKTFVFDVVQFKSRGTLIAKLMRNVHRIVRDRTVSAFPDDNFVGFDLMLTRLVRELPSVKAMESLDTYGRRHFKVVLYLMLTILCQGVGVDPVRVQRFWEPLELHKTQDRFNYAIANWEPLVHTGPLTLVATMMIAQANRSYSRGMFWDGLHAFYLPYVYKLFSEDNHFLLLRDQIQGHPLSERIEKFSEVYVSK